MAGPVLVIDLGTSGVRVATVSADGTVTPRTAAPAPPRTPADGLVEIDAAGLAALVLDLAAAALAAAGPVAAVAVTNQRATTVVWDEATGTPVGPGLGWQDLRTVGRCLELKAEGLRLAPNQSATKVEWLVRAAGSAAGAGLCAGTLDAFVVWHLTRGEVFVTDATNAAVTGLTDRAVEAWDGRVLDALGIASVRMPAIVPTVGAVGAATALAGAPPIVAIAGDQQASLVGQGCVALGTAKLTFGTGAMLDTVVGGEPPASMHRDAHGTFPIVAWRHGRDTVWGREAAMLSAGAAVAWLVDVGVLATVDDAATVGSGCASTGGVVFVPALVGLGTPWWDFGARGTFLGLTRGAGRAELVRAVLEGVAHRGADLVEAAERSAGRPIPLLRADGGMTRNPVFVQALADATGRAVAVSREVEATTLGAGLLGLAALGTTATVEELADRVPPPRAVEPQVDDPAPARERWAEAVARVRGWIPELAAIDF